MLRLYEINIFARVVSRKVETGNKTVDEVLATYPALTTEDINNIKAKL